MVPFIIRIPENEYELYKELARARGESLAEYFRKAARKTAKLKERNTRKYSIWDLGTKVILKGRIPKDSSVNFDKYLYEAEEKKLRKK
jgi:hypothetical protein